MPIAGDLVIAVRQTISVWYGNAILPGRVFNAVRGEQAEREAKSIGCELPKGSLGLTWHAWCRNYATFLRQKRFYDKKVAELRVTTVDGVPASLCAKSLKRSRLVEPRPVLSPEDLMSASIDKALRFSESFLLWLDLQPSSPRYPIGDEWFRLTLALTALYMQGQAEAFLKLKLASFDATSKSQTELPPVVAPFIERSIRSPTLLPGARGLALCTWIRRDLARAQAFVFFMKRSAAEMSAEQIRAAEEKSFTILTTPHVATPWRIEGPHGLETLVTPETLLEQVRRTVREVFGNEKFSTVRPMRVPSANAHFEYTRALGGAKAKVAALQPALPDFLSAFAEIPRIQELTRFRIDRLTIVHHAAAEHSEHRALMCELGFRVPLEEKSASVSHLVHWFDELVHQWAARDLTIHSHRVDTEPISAKIIGLAEPLKIRTITAGAEEAYFEASYLQKFVHGHLRKHPVFRLIGQTLTLDDINRTFHTLLPPGHFLVSGDYKSATDLISGDLSRACALQIARTTEMPTHLAMLFVDALVGHELVQGSGKTKKSAPQQNGQLMGSPLSFPVLCLVNAALTRYSLELNTGRVGMMDLDSFPLLINGDDVAFVTDRDGYEIWKTITKMGGLLFSLGKNFTSEDFVVLNSCMFEQRGTYVPHPMRSAATFRRVPPNSVRNGTDGTIVEVVVPLTQRMADYELIVAHGYADQELLPAWLEAPYLASRRNIFSVSPYLNPDYLGPQKWCPAKTKFSLGLEASSTRVAAHKKSLLAADEDAVECFEKSSVVEAAIQRSAHLIPAFRRFKLRNIDDLFKPEGYAILPGLQKAWLGSFSGEYRHRLNQVFLKSWGPVLRLSQGTTKPVHGAAISYTTDWWLPTGLGGLGLENTSPSRTIGDSSKASRQLAGWLLHHPEHVPAAMPCIKFSGELSRMAQKKLASLTPRFIPFGAPVPLGYSTHAAVIACIERLCWMETFQIERDCVIWERTIGKDRRAQVLADLLQKFSLSRSRLWDTGHSLSGGSKCARNEWLGHHAIREEELAAYLPPQRVYQIDLPSVPRTDLRADLMFLDETSILPWFRRSTGYCAGYTSPAAATDEGTTIRASHQYGPLQMSMSFLKCDVNLLPSPGKFESTDDGIREALLLGGRLGLVD